MKRSLLALGLVLAGAVGCGGGGGGPTGTTYTLASAAPFGVPPYNCQLLAGPATVGMGTMFYSITDAAPGNDVIESIIIADSFYISYGCNFDASTQAVSDDTFEGSHQSVGPVLADSYDFIVICHNPTIACQFDLTWTATY